VRLDEARAGVPRVATGISGFDLISFGGVPAGRTTLVAGTAGSGKTTFALQFLLSGALEGDPGVLITCEESPADMTRNVETFGWDLESLVASGRIEIVDASPRPDVLQQEVGEFDLGGLLARIEAAVEKAGARRIVLDSAGALFPQFESERTVRRELQRIVVAIRSMGVTCLLTTERTEEYGPVARHEVEEFVVDCAVVLRNPFDGRRRRRTLEILKLRGGNHRKGEFPFTMESEEGISVIPLSAIELDKPAAIEPATMGNPEVDEMLGGSVFGDSVMLVSGATGTGKTLLVAEFMRPVVRDGQRGLLMTFEESHDQILRNAKGWGIDLREAEEEGRLDVLAVYPERMGLEDLLVSLRRTIRRLKPERVALDSLTALERIASPRAFREFIVGLLTTLKDAEILGLLTNTSSSLLGGDTVTEAYVSTMTDGILLLRYVELEGEIRRAVAVLKMRGARHDHLVREYRIDGDGMHVGDPLPNLGPGFLRGGVRDAPGDVTG
jgi:circadian clock protein KaiC